MPTSILPEASVILDPRVGIIIHRPKLLVHANQPERVHLATVSPQIQNASVFRSEASSFIQESLGRFRKVYLQSFSSFLHGHGYVYGLEQGLLSAKIHFTTS